MAATYELLLQNPVGVFLGPLSSVHRCSYARGENVAGEMTLLLPDDVYDLSVFQPYGRILVQRTLVGGQPYVDLDTPWFILDGPLPSLADDGTALVEFTLVDALGLILSSRNIAYNDYNAYTDKLDKTDDLLKAFVRENAGSLATDTSRDLSGAMNVQVNSSQGPTLHVSGVARRQLLDVLQEVANASAKASSPVWLGFDIVLADKFSGLLEFRTYAGQRGVDHRQTVGTPPLILSPEAGNLANVRTGTLYADTASYVYAVGPGVGSIRSAYTASDSALIALSPFGRRERYVDGSQLTDPDALTALANSELRNGRPRKVMTGQLVETETTLRGVHWDFGDLATAIYQNDAYDVRIDRVGVTLTPGPDGGLVDSTQVLLRGELDVS